MSRADIQSLVGIASALGLVPILIVIVGRLWTTTYFDHIGLPSSGLEFDVYDYAFRSLEVLISLVLGVIGFSAAWLYRDWLGKRGFWMAFTELVAIGLGVAWAFFGVEEFLSEGKRTSTGWLGVSSGLPLAAMAWFAVDVWQGPGDFRHWGRWFTVALEPLMWLLSRIGWRATQRDVGLVLWRIVAIGAILGISFVYLPRVSEKLARVEAAADVATGKFAAAILEADGDLPPEIASSADSTKSNEVRVILTQNRNTYVLHSRTCTTVGDFAPLQASIADAALALVSDAAALAESLKVCKVFTIPTGRLRSIEYFQLNTEESASESVLRPVEVGLGDKPSHELFSSKEASDEEEIHCPPEGDGSPFFNSVWYEFTPPTDGTVLVRVQTDGFKPVVGVWGSSQEETTILENVTGSGEDPTVACETDVPDAEEQEPKVVGVVANVRAGTRYLAVVGAQKDGGGLGRVTFEFTPGGLYLYSGIPSEELPKVELPSAKGNAQLELSQLNTETYELQAFEALSKEPSGFSLVSESGVEVPLELVQRQDQDRTILDSQGTLDPGTWILQVPNGFVGQARLSTTTVQPNLTLALAEGSAAVLDVGVQGALLRAIDEMAIRDSLGLEGQVLFDRESLDPVALSVEPGEDDSTSARQLLEEAGADGLTVQIQVEEEREEERATLLRAADIVQQQLVAAGFNATIEPCEDVCLRVFFASE